MRIVIALTGNPGSSIAMLLRKIKAAVKHTGTGDKVMILKLPDTHALFSGQEAERPDVVIQLVDGRSLERHLYLSLPVMESGIPVVIAIERMYGEERNGDRIDCKKLADRLGVPVLPMALCSYEEVRKLLETALDAVKKQKKPDWITSGRETMRSFRAEDRESIACFRYRYIHWAVKSCAGNPHLGCTQACSDCLDRILTNRFLAFPIFLAVMYLMFSFAFSKHFLWIEGLPGPGAWMTELVKQIWEYWLELVLVLAKRAGASGWSISLAEDFLRGIGAWISCLPSVMIWYLLFSFLEDSGYMARVAFLMDPILCRLGMSGCSMTPLLLGFGCSLPALQAAAALEHNRERSMTENMIPFMPCSAKLPLYAVISAAIFEENMQTAVLFSLYLLGIAAAMAGAFLINRFACGRKLSYGIIELPQCRFPEGKCALMHGWEKTKAFAVKSVPAVVGSSVLFWFLSHFGPVGMCELEESFLALFGRAVRWVFIPLGWEDWRASVGAVAGCMAKENLVVILEQLYCSVPVGSRLPDIRTAYSYMVFQLFSMPCLAVMAAIRRRTGSWNRTLRIIGLQLLTAYAAAWGIQWIGWLFSCK